MTETIVKPPVNPSVKLLKDWGWLIAVLLLVAQQYGWLTADQIATIKRVIPVESTTETITVETTTKPAKLVEPVVAKPVEVAAIKPEDFKQWVDLIRIVIDELKPKPAPVDPKPKPEPKPVEPDVVPVDPKPLPTDSRIVITDETGKPVTAATVDAGALFLATAPGGMNIGWQVSKHGSARIATLPANAGYAFSLDAGSFVEYFLTDYAAKTQTSIRITCNSGPRPPPHVVPDVEPMPPVVGRKLSLAVLYEPKRISPSTAIVLNATDSWNGFIKDGHEWQFFDRVSPEPLAKQAVIDSGTATLPTLCIYEKTTRAKLGVIPLPTSVDELRAVVRMYEGGAK
jgi:hypothetical protein